MEPHSITTLFVLACALLTWGILSARLERWSITAPIAFVAVGVVLASGPVHLVEVAVADVPLRQAAELTLALVLFSDAARVGLRDLVRHATVPARLLGIGLPLTLIGSIGVALLLFDGLDPWAAAVIAAACSPTDAALGSAVVEDDRVPSSVRRSLSVESGLNDGIVTPAVVFFIAGAAVHPDSSHWEGSAVADLLLGALVGAGIGALAGRSLTAAQRAGWAAVGYGELAVVGGALACWSGAEALGGNGFVGAFAGGLVFGGVTRMAGRTPALDLDSSLGVLLSLVVWFVFGTALVLALGSVTLGTVVFAVLALTVLRIVPVAIALAGTGLDRTTVLFMGWFGPRGLASVVFALLAYEGLTGQTRDTVVSAVGLTVALSVLAHGATAGPGIRRYVASLRDRPPPAA